MRIGAMRAVAAAVLVAALASVATFVMAVLPVRSAPYDHELPVAQNVTAPAAPSAIDPLTIVAAPTTADSEAAAREAQVLNAAIPASTDPIVAARPFTANWATMSSDFMAARNCLAAAVHYEAASEGLAGQRAVAQVVLNRMRHPAYPHSVCGVVFQGVARGVGCQFTFACDGSLARTPQPNAWRRALAVADAALAGYVDPDVGTATHYHTWQVAPVWRLTLTKMTTIGAHIFYRWPGHAGQLAAFASRYAGGETVPALIPQSRAETEGTAVAAVAPPEMPVRDVSAATAAAQPAPTASAPNLLADQQKGELIVNGQDWRVGS